MLGLLWTCWHLPGFLSDAWPHPPFSIYLPMLLSLTIILSFAVSLSRFAAIPGILGHAVFNTTGTYLGGLFASESMSSQNSFWKTFRGMLQSVGVEPFAVGAGVVVAACGVTVALIIVATTRGRLSFASVSPRNP